MRTIVLSALVAVLVSCRPSTGRTPTSHEDAATPAQVATATGREQKSRPVPTAPVAPMSYTSSTKPPDLPQLLLDRVAYFQVWGSWLRNSRILSRPRRYSALTHSSNLETTPRFVTINRTGSHVAVDRGNAYDLFAVDGATLLWTRDKVPDGWLMMSQGSVFDGADEVNWDGSLGSLMVQLHHRDSAWRYVLQVRSQRMVVIGQLTGARSGPREALIVEVSRFLSPERRMSGLVWLRGHDGFGVGAVQDNGEVVLALRDGHFYRYAADAKPGTTDPEYTIEVQLDFEPREISIVGAEYAVLSRAEGGSALHLLDRSGKELWRVEIPFEVKQPPIDGNGRIYLAGNGFAAVERGKLVFAHPSDHVQWATAFEDGTVAVSTGSELRIVASDGTIRQTFRTQDGDQLTTPPAIAANGTVWVGSEKALYHLR